MSPLHGAHPAVFDRANSSVPAHVAWIENMREKLGTELPYPLIADLDTNVSQLYGMIHPGATAIGGRTTTSRTSI